ncbi:MAG: NTP transferase domain-containing protein [Bacteroidaceae bacterium]|nr:NTP transferase domain-containing protein [Bacteroidaceae bacterium]
MKYAIIAAGEGSRLAREGVKQPKPLIELQGVPIIERLVRLFMRHGASSVSIIINEQQPQTRALLQSLQEELPINLVVKDTPSSMHSMHALMPHLQGDEKFCLTTVDTLFHEKEFARYIAAFEQSSSDGLMAVTDYIDDEKPLYVETDGELNITAFGDSAVEGSRYISGGIYGLTPKALDTLQKCMEQGIARMRNFQRMLIGDGLALQAYPFTKIIDIDHAEDIGKAEEFLNEEK